MKASVGLLARNLAKRGRKATLFDDGQALEMTLATCRVYERGSRLAPNTLYLAQADALARRITLPAGSAVLIAGAKPKATRIAGPRIEIADISFTQALNDALEEMQSFENLESELRGALDRDDGVQRLIDIAAPWFENELIVMNSNFRVVAHSHERIRLYDVSGIEQPTDDYVPVEVASHFQNDAIYRDVERAREPFYYDPSVFSVRVYCLNIVVQNEYAARLVLGETETPIDPCDEKLFEFLGGYIQKHYDRTVSAFRSESDMMASLVSDLLDGVAVSPERAERVTARREWNREDALVCACVMPSGYESRERTLPYYCRDLARSLPQSCAIESDGYVALVVNLDASNEDEASFYARLTLLQREANLRIGLSPVFHNIAEVRDRFAQARITLEIAAAERPHLWRNSFSDMRLSFLRHAATQEISRDLLVAEEIELLARHDAENGTSYVETLRTYLANGMNALQSASALFIHRATMVYRLKRIQEIAGIDFDDCDQVLYLQISFRIFRDE